jgi:hypothetical protein
MWRLASAVRGKNLGRDLKSPAGPNSLCHSQARTGFEKYSGLHNGALEPKARSAGAYPQWWRQKTNISFQMPAESLGYYCDGHRDAGHSASEEWLRGEE